ncbi:MAG: GAF domain-containing protein [Bacteroidia bacterium]|nr:GAF domain-containing protein [Bacteroidia bacterium]
MHLVLENIKSVLNKEELTVADRLEKVCQLLQDSNSHYDWVGFYFADPDKRELHLGPFVGEPTNHLVIPFGKGICGQVAENNESFVVPDVEVQDNYIACSIDVRSEIVVPLFVEGKNVGQIDIDSHTPNAFSEDDERLLEKVNIEVAKIL